MENAGDDSTIRLKFEVNKTSFVIEGNRQACSSANQISRPNVTSKCNGRKLRLTLLTRQGLKRSLICWLAGSHIVLFTFRGPETYSMHGGGFRANGTLVNVCLQVSAFCI